MKDENKNPNQNRNKEREIAILNDPINVRRQKTFIKGNRKEPESIINKIKQIQLTLNPRKKITMIISRVNYRKDAHFVVKVPKSSFFWWEVPIRTLPLVLSDI